MQKLIDALEEKIGQYRQVMDTGPEGDDPHWQGIVVGIEYARDLTAEMAAGLSVAVGQAILGQLIEMKAQILEAMEEDLRLAVENDRMMQENQLREIISRTKIEKAALESAALTVEKDQA